MKNFFPATAVALLLSTAAVRADDVTTPAHQEPVVMDMKDESHADESKKADTPLMSSDKPADPKSVSEEPKKEEHKKKKTKKRKKKSTHSHSEDKKTKTSEEEPAASHDSKPEGH